MPLGLIIFLLFNKYLGILGVLESKQHLTYAEHLSALVCNGSLLFHFYEQWIQLFFKLSPLVALTRVDGEKNAEFLLLEEQPMKIIGKIPSFAINCIIFLKKSSTKRSIAAHQSFECTSVRTKVSLHASH